METVKSTGSGLNTYEELRKQMRGTNPLYEDQAWLANARYGTLDAYVAMAAQLGADKTKAEEFKKAYDYDFLSDKYKTLAMSNELYSDRTKTSKRTYTDDNGVEVTKEMSDYDYNKMLLQNDVAANKEAWERDQFNKMLEERSWLQKVADTAWNAVNGIVTNTVGGFINSIGSVYNIVEGITGATSGLIEGGLDLADERFREAMKTNELSSVAESLKKWNYEYDREHGGYDYYGNRKGFYNFLDSLGDSFGRMVPTIIVGKIGSAIGSGVIQSTKVGQVLATPVDIASKIAKFNSTLAMTNKLLFYSTMASNDITESLNDKNLAKLPTYLIVGRSVTGAAIEMGIESLLAKGFGKTVIDQLTYGLDSVSTSGMGVTKGTVIGRITKDALQEGLEEVLQDYSHWFTDNCTAFVLNAIGNTKYADIFHNASEFNMKTLTTAFMAGAIMSLAGSAIDILKTQNIDTGKPVLDKDGNVVRDKKGNIKTEKFGKFKSYLVEKSTDSIKDSAIAILESNKYTNAEKAKILESINASIHTLYDLYNNVGEAEFNNAVNMLASLHQAYSDGADFMKTGSGDVSIKLGEFGTAAAMYNFSDKLKSMYAKIGTPLDMHTDESINEEAKTYHHGEPVGIVTKESVYDESSGVTAEEDAKLKEILDETGAELGIVTEQGDGASITKDGKAVLVPKAHVDNLSKDELVATIAETSLIRSLSTDKRYSYVIGKFIEMYKKLPGNEKLEDNEQTRREVVVQLMTNQEFLYTAMQLGNRDVFAFVNELYSNANSIDTSTILDLTYTAKFVKMVERCKQVIVDYVSNNPLITDYVDYAFFTPNDIDTIRRNRWNLDLGKRLTKNGYVPTDDDVKVFTNKVNALPVPIETKEQMINDFINGTPLYALRGLTSQLYYIYNSMYDNKVYMEPVGIGNVLMNTFLHTQGITIMQINDLYKDTNKLSAGLYNEIRLNFENYTGGKYTFTIDDKTEECKVIEKNAGIDTYIIGVQGDALSYNKALSALNRTLINALSYSGKYGKAALSVLESSVDFDKVPKTLKRILSINDIITTPYFWSEEFKTHVQTSEQAYKYLKQELIRESKGRIGISIDSNGKYTLVNLVNRFKTLSTNHVDTIEDMIASIIAYLPAKEGEEIRNDFSKKTGKSDFRYLFIRSANGFLITDIIDSKYVPEELKSTKIKFVQEVSLNEPNSDGGITNGYYDSSKNELVLGGVAFQEYAIAYFKSSPENWLSYTINYILQVIFHEYEHALQHLNSLSGGGQPIFDRINNKAVQSMIIKDVLQHMPELAVDDDGKKLSKAEIKRDISFMIYASLDAEQAARGVSHDLYAFGSPFFYIEENDHEYIYTPWGSRYDITIPTNSTFVKSGETSHMLPRSVKKSDVKTETSTESAKPTTTEKEGALEKFKKSREEVKAAKEKAAQKKKIYIPKTVNTKVAKTYYLGAYGGGYITANIYNMLTSIGDPKPYDKVFIEAAKSGELTSTKTVTDFLLKNDVNDATLDLIAKTVFDKKLSIENIKYYTKNAANIYALRAVAKRMVSDGFITKQEYDKLFFAITSPITTFQTVFKYVKSEDSKGNSTYVKLMADIRKRFLSLYDDASQRQMLVKLLSVNGGYDGTPDSVVKAALYARKKSFEESETGKLISLESEVGTTKNKNADGEMVLADVLSAEKLGIKDELAEFISDDTILEYAVEIAEARFAEYAQKQKYSKADLRDAEKRKQISANITIFVEDVIEEIKLMSAKEITAEYNRRLEAGSLETIDDKVRDRLGLAQNTQQQVTRISNAIRLPSGYISKKIFKLLCEKYPDFGFKPDADLSKKYPDIWSMPTRTDGSPLDRSEVSDLNDKLKEVFKWAKKIATGKLKIEEERNKLKAIRETLIAERAKRIEIEKERDKLKAEKEKWAEEGKNVQEYKADVETVYIDSVRQMPDKFKLMLGTIFRKLRTTKAKFGNINEMHTVKEYQVWIDDNADTLLSITSDDANDILDWILNSNAVSRYGSDEDIKYEAVTLWVYSYIYENRAALGVDENLIQQVQDKFDHDKSKWGTLLSLSKKAMQDSKSSARIIASIANTYGIQFDPKDILDLTDTVENLKYSSDEEYVNSQISKIRELRQRMYEKALEKYKGNKRDLLGKIESFERLMMLSGPGTWIRNLTSNLILGPANKVTAKLGDKVFGPLKKIAGKISEQKKRKALKMPEYDKSIDAGIEVASKLLNTDVSSLNADDLDDALARMDKIRLRANKEVQLGSEFKINEADYALKIAKDALDKSIKENKNDDIINYYKSKVKIAERMLKQAKENKAKVPAHRKEAIKTSEENIVKLNKKISDLKAKDKLTLDDEFKIHTYKESIEYNKTLIEMYSDPESYLEKVTTAYSAVSKLIEYNNAMAEYNEKLSSDPFKNSLKSQYDIVNTTPTNEVVTFVKKYVIESGLLDLLKDGLSRYDAKRTPGEAGRLVDMVKAGIRNKIFSSYKFDIEVLNKLNNLLFSTVLSDDKFVQKAFVYYAERMLTEKGTDLSHDITDEVLEVMNEAYTQAAYDYMHSTNIVYNMESVIKEKLGPTAYFIYKQLFPFAGASTNWYFESLRWSPAGLIIALGKLNGFDKYTERMQKKNRAGEGPSEKFAYYLLRRDIGKGLIGTGVWLLAALLGLTGVIKVIEDETDKKLKLAVGKNNFITIDLSEIQPTYSLVLGAIMGGAYDNADTFWKMLKSSLDYMAEDSVIGDVLNMFDGYSISDTLEYRAQMMLSMFIPNLLKTFTSSLYNFKVKYSKGLMGQLEKIAVQAIPGLAYAMPKQYDPYTGELQYKYYPNFWGWISGALSKFGPVKIKPRKLSETEKIALSLGVTKTALKGKYNDIGQLSAKDIATLNEKYGLLNKTDLKEFVTNKKGYKVKAVDSKGRELNYYQTLRFSQMNDEQKKSVINRIMSDNAKISKIYVWTSNGHKYYASETEYSELAKLGIYKNVFLASGYHQGFED